MSASEKGQVTANAAEIYEELFVPALFREWAPRLADAARVAPGQAVLDVACGTGVLTRELARRTGPTGSVSGVDLNEGMLLVAKRRAPELTWLAAPAEALPFGDAGFDAAVSQFGLMFFEDRSRALREMIRVVRPGGRVALAVWDTLERSPGYAPLAALMAKICGDGVARGLSAPFSLGNTSLLRSVLDAAGMPSATLTTVRGRAHFPSMRSWIHTEVKGWTLAESISDEKLETLCQTAELALASLVQSDGTVAFESAAHIVSLVRDEK